jgi:hypothetical protein
MYVNNVIRAVVQNVIKDIKLYDSLQKNND